MTALVIIGVILTLLGLVGLIVVVTRANRARKEGLSSEEMQARLKALIPMNLGSLFVSTIGLMCVILGLFLG